MACPVLKLNCCGVDLSGLGWFGQTTEPFVLCNWTKLNRIARWIAYLRPVKKTEEIARIGHKTNRSNGLSPTVGSDAAVRFLCWTFRTASPAKILSRNVTLGAKKSRRKSVLTRWFDESATTIRLSGVTATPRGQFSCPGSVPRPPTFVGLRPESPENHQTTEVLPVSSSQSAKLKIRFLQGSRWASRLAAYTETSSHGSEKSF